MRDYTGQPQFWSMVRRLTSPWRPLPLVARCRNRPVAETRESVAYAAFSATGAPAEAVRRTGSTRCPNDGGREGAWAEWSAENCRRPPGRPLSTDGPGQAPEAMNTSSPGPARNNRKAPRCERHDALLHPEEQAELAARFPAGHQAQMAFLLAAYTRNASAVAALLGTRARTVHRYCRGWSMPPGPRLRRALRRRVLDLVCPRCLSDRAVEEARQAKRDARRAARRIPREQDGPHR
jgi:hypothetical protein